MPSRSRSDSSGLDPTPSLAHQLNKRQPDRGAGKPSTGEGTVSTMPKLTTAARKGTTGLTIALRQSRGFRSVPRKDPLRRELAFHVAEIVVDVQKFLDAKNVGEAWEQLCRHLEFHWPYHARNAKKLIARIERNSPAADPSRRVRS